MIKKDKMQKIILYHKRFTVDSVTSFGRENII